MPIAYVLINVEISSDEEVLKELKKVERVVEAHTVYGVYDIVAKIESDTMERLDDIISQVRQLKNVHSTLTMLVY